LTKLLIQLFHTKCYGVISALTYGGNLQQITLVFSPIIRSLE